MPDIPKKTPYIVLAIISLLLTIFYITQPKVQLAGDIVEYYGITESLLNHGSVKLTTEDRNNLEKVLHPEYFEDPGYYIQGKQDARYPVHFALYSIMVLPFRILLNVFGLNQLNALTITNIFIIISALFYLFKKKVDTSLKKLFLIFFIFLSPIAFFIPWPGPDVFYLLLILLSIYSFMSKQYFLSALMMTIASWQSQPLIISAFLITIYYIFSENLISLENKKFSINLRSNVVLKCLLIAVIVFIPYFYNLWAFGVLTPWTLLQNWWTQLYGFGINNISLKRLIEQFFDPNMGLFWYAPSITILGFYLMIKNSKNDKRYLFFLLIIFSTAFFYHTNPSWHFGTAGYGPSRHIIFVLPFLIYVIVESSDKIKDYIKVLILTLLIQLVPLFINGSYLPDFTNSLYNSPYAKFFIENFPQLYNPTPEIFVDRTGHKDLYNITSAIYKDQAGVCYKAYVLRHEKDVLIKNCGYVPAQYENYFESDPYLKPSSDYKIATTYEVTLWPDNMKCDGSDYTGSFLNSTCLKNKEEVMELTNIDDSTRIENFENRPGVWKIKFGQPFTIKIPPSYVANIYHVEGIYVNYYR